MKKPNPFAVSAVAWIQMAICKKGMIVRSDQLTISFDVP